MAKSLAQIAQEYDALMKTIDARARQSPRAYGGYLRAAKGHFTETTTVDLVEIAWKNLRGHPRRLSFTRERVRIPLKPAYLGRIPRPEVAKYIKAHIADYFYGIASDVHVSIDGRLVMAIESKSYTENAMFKRILVDFTLLRTAHPKLQCVLLQLESQLTGDYSDLSAPITYGSHSTHTLLSHFDVDLHIITLLHGERRVNEPVHNLKHYKPLTVQALARAVDSLSEILRPHV